MTTATNTRNKLGRGERSAPARPGSALIVVIGALSLIAVLAALYVTIGQGDQRVAVVADRTREVADVDRTYAQHVMDIVAADRWASFPRPFVSVGGSATNPVDQRFFREATDHPYTDWQMRSVFPLPDNDDPWIPVIGNDNDARRLLGFNPVGDASTPWEVSDILDDRRVASDPWLAATEPSAIVWRSIPTDDAINNTSNERIDSDGRAYSLLRHNNLARNSHPTLRYMDHRDWSQISNVAPDGRFVNLFNLRGNFDAEPGIGQRPNGEHRMTSRLTLLEPIRMRRSAELRATTRLPNGLGDMATDGPFVEERFLNIPAVWTMNQRFMFFPMNQPERFRVGRVDATGLTPATAADWGNYEFPDYQYADADGDGMADARWFELADASNPANIVFDIPPGETRFFAAARIVDLSAMVNVNTATDGLTPPTSWSPSGMTPADVDLRRLLTMADQARNYRPFPFNQAFATADVIDPNAWRDWNLTGSAAPGVTAFLDGLSYRHIEQPFGYNLLEGETLAAENYFGYAQLVEDADGTTAQFGIDEASELIGNFAYDAVRRSIEDDAAVRIDTGLNPAWFGDGTNAPNAIINLQQSSPFEFTTTENAQRLYDRLATLNPTGAGALPNPFFNGTTNDVERPYLARDEYYRVTGSLDPTDATLTERDPQVADRFGAELFGIGDLSELLTFRGLNDDTRYSRLERVMAGRFNINGPIEPTSTLRFTPLRSNRSTDLERRSHDSVDGYRVQYPANDVNVFDRDDVPDAESMALFALSPRSRLTTVSGASPIRSGVVFDPRTNGPWDGRSTNPPSLTGLTYTANSLTTNVNFNNAGSNDRFTTFADYRDDIVSFTASGDLGDYFLKVGRALNTADEADTRIDLRLLIDLATRTPSNTSWRLNTGLGGFPTDDYSVANRAAMDRLFKLYADALAPDTELEEGLAWEDGSVPTYGGARALWTLSYGNRGPEPALHAAAHLAVNMKDLADVDNEPSAATLLIDGTTNTNSGQAWAYRLAGTTIDNAERDYAFQWGAAQQDNALTDAVEGGYIFDLDRIDTEATTTAQVNRPINTKLHRDDSGSLTDDRRALTVFGIEAHPIITEAASMIVYTDSSPSETPVFSADPTAGDVAVQVMVFQLHNPFSESVQLGSEETFAATTTGTQTDLEDWDYYIEFNGWIYPIASYIFDATPTPPFSAGYRFSGAGTLAPGETQNFVAINYPDHEGLATKWNSIRSAHSGIETTLPSFTRENLDTFIDELFRGPGLAAGADASRDPILLQPINPATGERLADLGLTGPFNIFDAAPGVGGFTPPRTDNGEVRLWRTYSNPSTDTGPNGEAAVLERPITAEKWIENDILIDRLRDPATDTWDVTFNGDASVSLTDAPRVSPPSTVPASDNHVGGLGFGGFALFPEFQTSFTVTRWASVRRPDNEDIDGTLNPPGLGGVPAYMLESVTTPTGMNALENIVSSVLPAAGDLSYLADFRNGINAIDFTSNFGANEQERIRDAYVAVNFTSFLDSIGLLDGFGPPNDPTPGVSGPGTSTDRGLIASLQVHPYEKGTNTRSDVLATSRNGAQSPSLPEVNVATPTTLSPQTTVDGSTGLEIADPQLQPELYTRATRFARSLGTSIEPISILRVTDILRPLAIGPAHFPAFDPAFNAANGNGSLDIGDGEWLTLGEALSIALGFEDVNEYIDNRDPTTGAQAVDYSPLYDAVQTVTGTTGTPPPIRIFDRGQIRLNDYVPFINISIADEVRDIPLYQPELGDYRMHDGATAAGRLLASVRTLTPRVGTNPGDPESELQRANRGVININTAPAAVLRLLPGLTPSLEVDSDGRDEWWAARPTDLSQPRLASQTNRDELGIPDVRPESGPGSNYAVTNPAGTAPDLWRDRPDVAATLLAYRDRTLAEFRFDSREPFADDNRIDDLTFAPLRFFNEPSNANQSPLNRFGMIARNYTSEFGSTAWNVATAADRGRYLMNGIEAVRERPGFGSYGELLGATIAETDPLQREGVSNLGSPNGYIGTGDLLFDELSLTAFGTDTTRWQGDDTNPTRSTTLPTDINNDDAINIFGVHDIFHLARDIETGSPGPAGDPRNLGVRDITTADDDLVITLDPYLHTSDTITTDINQPDELPNDYDEQLAILAGLANTTDVRSDYFAAWLLIRGYQEADVADLDENEPMLPTVEKRFLLVLDRSNVTAPGDQPRILLYRELPL